MVRIGICLPQFDKLASRERRYQSAVRTKASSGAKIRVSKYKPRTYRLVLLAILSLTPPVIAQDQNYQLFWCHEKMVIDYDTKINACTALIESRRLNAETLARVFHSRADAYGDKGDYEHAIAD